MKIYTYIESEWNEKTQAYEITYSESEDYSGLVASCKTSVNVPPPPGKTDEEKAMDAEMLALLRGQREETEQFQPFLYEAMGLREVDGKLERIPVEERGKTAEEITSEIQLRKMGYSPTGQQLTEEEITAGLSPSEQREYSLYKQLQERQDLAYKGELPVSPALEEQLKAQEAELAVTLSQRLGPNWMESTPGIQAMSQLRQKSELLREEARRGQLTTGEAMLQGRMGAEQSSQAQAGGATQLYAGLNQQRMSQYAAVPGRTSGLISQYAGVLQPYQQERMQSYDLQTSAAMQSAANKAQLYGGLIGAGGMLGGMLGGAAILT